MSSYPSKSKTTNQRTSKVKCESVKRGSVCPSGSNCFFEHDLSKINKSLYLDETYSKVVSLTEDVEKIKKITAYHVNQNAQLSMKLDDMTDIITSINNKMLMLNDRLNTQNSKSKK